MVMKWYFERISSPKTFGMNFLSAKYGDGVISIAPLAAIWLPHFPAKFAS
jgi:hypothetical protein